MMMHHVFMNTSVWISIFLTMVVVNVHDYPFVPTKSPVGRWKWSSGITRLTVLRPCVWFTDLQISRSWMFFMTVIYLLKSFVFWHHSFQLSLSLSLFISLVELLVITVMGNVAWNNTVHVARNPHWIRLLISRNNGLVHNFISLSLSLSLSLSTHPASSLHHLPKVEMHQLTHRVSRRFTALHCSFTFASVRTLPSSCLIQMVASLYMMASGEITRK